jgi:hypothetical protein
VTFRNDMKTCLVRTTPLCFHFETHLARSLLQSKDTLLFFEGPVGIIEAAVVGVMLG